MISVELVVRDEDGRVLDPAGLDVSTMAQLAGRTPADVFDPLGSGSVAESLKAVERVVRKAAALRVACVAALADAVPTGWSKDQENRICDELMVGLIVSRRSAQFTWHQAEVLRSQPAVWAALAAGAIDLTRAVVLADALLEIPRHDEHGSERPDWEAERGHLLELGLPYAQEHTARQLSRYLRRQLIALGCPDPTRRRAVADRGLWIAHDGQGGAELTARLSSEDAEKVYATIRAFALADRNGDPAHSRPGCPEPTEPMDVWMAAAFVDTVLGTGGTSRWPSDECHGAAPAAGGSTHEEGAAAGAGRVPVQTVINVTVPIDSLAGLTDQPGVINGFGIIPAETARRLAAGDARWRHLLISTTSGALLDVGTLSYRPPAALARHVRLRDGTCRFPGCTVPARECDLDHLIPFPQGSTSAENLHALCRRHHGLKHDDGWRVEAVERQGLRWTSPHGARATTYPDDTLSAVA